MSTGDPLPGRRRVCLLTGAGGRLGNAFCRAYAERYDIVAVCRRRRPDAVSQYETFVDPLNPAGELAENRHPVHVVYADLTDAADVDRVVEVALARFGSIDLLVNNAAAAALHPHGVVDGDAALRDVDQLFAANVGAPLRLAVRVAQQFWRTRDLENREFDRNVVNVSSTSGSRVYAHHGQAVYSATKAALDHLTRHLAAEFADFGVRVNGLAPNNFPGVVSTESVARAVVRLDSEPVTGRILVVDAPPPEVRTPAPAADTLVTAAPAPGPHRDEPA